MFHLTEVQLSFSLAVFDSAEVFHRRVNSQVLAFDAGPSISLCPSGCP